MVDVISTITLIAPWLIFSGCILVVLVLNAIVIRYYSDRTKSEWIPSIAAWLGMTFALICLCLTPVDIYATSKATTIELADSPIFGIIKILYYVLYGVVIGFAFVVLPFVYFYYEAYDPNKTTARQCFDGFKFTIGFFIVLVICIVVGLFVSTGGRNGGDDTNFKDWVNALFDTTNRGERALLFCLGCLSTLGMLVWITYTSFGFSSFPIGLIRGRMSIAEEKNAYKKSVQYAESKRSLLDDDSGVESATLSRDKSAMENRLGRLEKFAGSCGSTCRKILRPFAVVFGIFFSLISLFLAICIILGAVVQILSNYCGLQCGFILKEPRIHNPIDKILVILHKYYPLDFVIVALIILYFFFCTINGIRRISIRCFCFKLYDFSRKHTAPPGLIFGAFLMMLATLALNVQFMTLAPQYAYWGGLVFKNETDGTTKPCSIDYAYSEEREILENGCQMTQVGKIFTTLKWNFSYFGVAFYFISWAFIVTFLIGIIVSFCSKRDSNIEVHSDDDMDEYD